jgi:hypothetical protein
MQPGGNHRPAGMTPEARKKGRTRRNMLKAFVGYRHVSDRDVTRDELF